MPPTMSPYGPQTWQMPPRQGVPLQFRKAAQPQGMYGIPSPPDQSSAAISPAMGYLGPGGAGPSKADPNQIPRPIPSASVILHETCQGSQANPPPTIEASKSGCLALPHPSEEPIQFVLQQYNNSLSKKLNDVVNEIRRKRCSYLRLKLFKKEDSTGAMFFSYMVEDNTPSGLSYVEFLVHIHRQIQSKMP